MTTVTFKKSDELFCGFTVTGHTGYADSGEDIVCAAISSAVQLTINGIDEFATKKLDVEVKDAFIDCTLTESNEIAQAFLGAFYIHVKSLLEDYNKYIKIKYSEV